MAQFLQFSKNCAILSGYWAFGTDRSCQAIAYSGLILDSYKGV